MLIMVKLWHMIYKPDNVMCYIYGLIYILILSVSDVPIWASQFRL